MSRYSAADATDATDASDANAFKRASANATGGVEPWRHSAQEDEGNGSGGTKKPIGQDKAEDYGTQWGGDRGSGSMAF